MKLTISGLVVNLDHLRISDTVCLYHVHIIRVSTVLITVPLVLDVFAQLLLF